MGIAEKYNLLFGVSVLKDFIISPYIVAPRINGGFSNQEIASFLEPLDIINIERIERDIKLFLTQYPLEEEIRIKGMEGLEYIQIRWQHNVSCIVLNTRGIDVIIPLHDFLQLLDEWRNFLDDFLKGQ